MKTITIPTDRNPFIVVINNKVYQYRAGETIEVPDEVAEAIEDALELIPKPKRYLSSIAQIANGTISAITMSDLDGAENIVYYAFGQCYSLASVEIPNTVKSIKNSAFDGCTSLERVWLPEIPPALSDPNAFNKIKSNCVFYCKSQASLDAYKTATNWKALTSVYSFVVEA